MAVKPTFLSSSRSRSLLPLLLLLSITTLFPSPTTAKALTTQFQSFYPQHADKYTYHLTHNCSREFANYLTGRPEDFELDWLGGGGPKTVIVQPVVKCLLDNVSEYIKSASSSAQVLLGVTPPILATLGPSTDELAMLNVVGRRPFLALLLSFGSPSVYIDRVFDFRRPDNMLRRDPAQYHLGRSYTPFQRWALVVFQYVLVIGAVVNVALLNWQLGLGTVCAWWAETVYGPLVWNILGVPIHMAGVFSLRLRMRRIYSEEERDITIPIAQWFRLLPRRLWDYGHSEWVPAVTEKEKIRIKPFAEGRPYVVWSWALSTSTVIHILFGSLLFSGLLFIGPRDALVVIFRYVVSVLICRSIVMFELAGMRSPHEEEDTLEMEHECKCGASHEKSLDVRLIRAGRDSPVEVV